MKVTKVVDLDPGGNKAAMDCVICNNPMDMDDIRHAQARFIIGELEDCIAYNSHFFERDERGERKRAATYDAASACTSVVQGMDRRTGNTRYERADSLGFTLVPRDSALNVKRILTAAAVAW